MLAFLADRSALAHAYSRAATFSVQTAPALTSEPYPRPPTARHGRADVLAALLALPDDPFRPECDDADEGEDGDGCAALEIDYDVVRLADVRVGDFLLICYGVGGTGGDRACGRDATRKEGGESLGKGKGRARATDLSPDSSHESPPLPEDVGLRRWAYDQRFVLRRRERDEEDR